jgi:hypothetical protein
MAKIADARKNPDIPLALINSTLFVSGLLRVRSLNALEAELEKAWFAHAVGAEAPAEGSRLFSAETVSRQLVKMGAKGPRALLEGIIHKAERNKVFREGWIGALRYVAIDGWEPVRSYGRHCPHCLERTVMVGEGEAKHAVTQYYHRCVVALLLGEHEEMVLGFESLRTREQRHAAGQHSADCDEGEETAAIRLVGRLRATYGNWLDVIVADGLYSNGPFLSELEKLRFGAVIVIKKETDEPLREALQLWAGKPPTEVVEDREADEFIELWDCKDLQTLGSFKGPIRVTRALVRRRGRGSHAVVLHLHRRSSAQAHTPSTPQSHARALAHREHRLQPVDPALALRACLRERLARHGGRLRFPLQRIQPLAALHLPSSEGLCATEGQGPD